MKTNLKKFKVEFVQTKHFIVDVYAKNKKDAEKKAEEKWLQEDYQEVGDCKVETSAIYDVTHTNDPFDAEN